MTRDMKSTSVSRRARRSAMQWTKLVAEAEATPLSLSDFCDENEISLATMQQWRRRLKTQGQRKNHAQATFLPVRVQRLHTEVGVTNKPPGHIDIVLTNGRLLRLAGAVDTTHLRNILDAVDGDRSC